MTHRFDGTSVLALMATLAFVVLPAAAQDAAPKTAPSSEGTPQMDGGKSDARDQTLPEAGPRADQALGKTFDIKPDALPEPYATDTASNNSQTVPRGEHKPIVPPGFQVTLFADKLADPRQLAVLSDGSILLAQQDSGEVTWLKDDDGDGKSDRRETVASGMQEPYGIVMKKNGDLYVADSRGIFMAVDAAAKLAGENAPTGLPLEMTPVTDMGVFGDPGGHSTRSLAIDPGSGKMYSGVGSTGNIDEEAVPRATVQVFDADGKNQQSFATGTRNPIGIGFNPTTGKLWVTVQERDGMGNELVPDYFTELIEGGFYGWPYSYIGQHPQPDFADKAPDKVKSALTPSLLMEAHSSAMDFVFYQGNQFPSDYHGDAFLTLKGSWNRADPTGYKVVRARFKDGEPVGGYENFMTGFWIGGDGNGSPAKVWGRPATIAETPDGALLVGDDTGGTIWRVSYAGDTSSQRAELKAAKPQSTANQSNANQNTAN